MKTMHQTGRCTLILNYRHQSITENRVRTCGPADGVKVSERLAGWTTKEEEDSTHDVDPRSFHQSEQLLGLSKTRELFLA